MPNTKANNDIVKDELADWVVARFNESKNYYSQLYDKFDQWDKQYFSIADNRLYDWQSNVFVPETYKAVKTILARIIAALFSVNPPFDVVGVEAKDKPGEIPKKQLVGFQFDKTKIPDKFVLFVLQALIRGTSVGKVVWKRDYSYIPKVIVQETEEDVFVDEQGKPLKKGKSRKVVKKEEKTIYQRIINYEGPDFEVIDINGGFFVDPFASDLSGWKIHRTLRTRDYLEKNRAKFDNVDLAINSDYPTEDGEFWKHSRLENLGLTEPTDSAKDTDDKGTTNEQLDKYEILEFHGQYDVNDDGKLEDSIITVCNRSVVIKKRITPYTNGCFVKIGFMPVLNEFYWQGVCELVENQQTELNDKTNQRLDNVNLCLQKILAYVEDAVDPRIMKNFVFKPGAKLPVKDLNAIHWEAPEDVTQSSYNETKILKDDIQETSGAVSVMQAQAQGSDVHRTASGLFMLKGEAETNIKLIVQMMESQGLAEIAEKYDLLNSQLMSKPQTIRILGEQGYQYPTITPEEYRYYNCDFIFKGASAYVNREIRLAQLTKIMDIFAKVPQLMMQFDPQKIGKMITNTLGFQENELMRSAGIENLLMRQGLMGQPGQQPGMQPPGIPGNDLMSSMTNQTLPLEQVMGQINQMNQNYGGQV